MNASRLDSHDALSRRAPSTLRNQHRPRLTTVPVPPRPTGRVKQALRRLLRAFEYVCWTVGVVGIAWCVISYLGIMRFQDAQANRLESLRQMSLQPGASKPGDPIGKISIPRVGLSAIVAEGIDDATLKHAVGHLPGTPIPNQPGTVVLAGHRDTFFRGLAHVRPDDLIALDTPRAEYRYKVVHTQVADPRQVELLESSPQSDLTLVTCFPFHYVGPAPKRFVVQASRCAPSSACRQN
jgi:sortase A